jgi:hypothetical protein
MELVTRDTKGNTKNVTVYITVLNKNFAVAIHD